jgi:quercetin dioxygenase-like cupin family protein
MEVRMDDRAPDRVREAPQQRFAPPAQTLDLEAVTEQLRREPSQTASTQGHRQIALFRHGPMTLALYLFDRGGRLPDHVVDGPVVIQCLEGHLTVSSAEVQHDLPQGTLLRLARGVPHDVIAQRDSRMLLIIALEGSGSHSLDQSQAA